MILQQVLHLHFDTIASKVYHSDIEEVGKSEYVVKCVHVYLLETDRASGILGQMLYCLFFD